MNNNQPQANQNKDQSPKQPNIVDLKVDANKKVDTAKNDNCSTTKDVTKNDSCSTGKSGDAVKSSNA